MNAAPNHHNHHPQPERSPPNASTALQLHPAAAVADEWRIIRQRLRRAVCGKTWVALAKPRVIPEPSRTSARTHCEIALGEPVLHSSVHVRTRTRTDAPTKRTRHRKRAQTGARKRVSTRLGPQVLFPAEI